MSYIENPKTKGSGIKCCIPQAGGCPVNCADCFFQSGRSYLEPLDERTPNMPSPQESAGYVIRVNDGNDSSYQRRQVILNCAQYPEKFYNTSSPNDIQGFDAPGVLTVNPAGITDTDFHKIDVVPDNLMAVRARVNTWNMDSDLINEIVSHYSLRSVPILLTFMAYYTQKIPGDHADYYEYRNRTMNSYWVIKPEEWDNIMDYYRDNNMVYACGKDALTFACSRCGNCLREYYATRERMRPHD